MKNLKPQNQPWTHEKFIEKATEVHGNAFEYLSTYINSKSKVKVKCTKHGHVHDVRAHSHLEGYGCKSCCYLNHPQNQKKTTMEEYEKKCKELHNNKYIYFQDYDGTNSRVTIYCPIHDYKFTQFAYAHLGKGHGCSKCKQQSKGEAKICELFTYWDFPYEREKKFTDLKGIGGLPLRFDFYLDWLNLIIEFDGPQHFEEVKFFGGRDSYERLIKNDEIKNNYCNTNGITLLRIKYNEDIFSQINHLFY